MFDTFRQNPEIGPSHRKITFLVDLSYNPFINNAMLNKISNEDCKMSESREYLAQAAARTMIGRASTKGLAITNLKIQKLLYFAHGLMLSLYGRGLVNENFQAWKYGPVVESLYHALKFFGPSTIPPSSVFITHWEQIPNNDDEAIFAIDSVLDQLGNCSGGRLIDLSHDKNGPWYSVYHDKTKNIEIENDAIKAYFDTIVKKK